MCTTGGTPQAQSTRHANTHSEQINTGGFHLAQQQYGRILMPIRVSELTNTTQN